MGQFLKVNGDYNIRVADGASIVLDTGPAVSGGSVVVTGDLVVQGSSFSIDTVNLTITDNIISLNQGDPGPGVTLGYSGIEVNRGNTTAITPQNNASFLYDESLDSWIIAHGTAPGPFNFSNSSLKVSKIINNDTVSPGITLLPHEPSGGTVNVFGYPAYESQVTHDDDIPNKKYVDDAILTNPTFQIVAPQSQDTKIVIADKDITPNVAGQPGSLAFFANTNPGITNTGGESAVSVIVDGALTARFYSNRFEAGLIELGGGEARNEITTVNGVTNENIVVRTQGTGKLQTNYALQLERIGTSGETPPLAFPNTPLTPAYVPGSTLIYAASAGIGTTGLYYTNDTLNSNSQPGTGELISKNKALVFSMIF